MSEKIHTIQSSDKNEFDNEVNFFLGLGCKIMKDGYKIINNDDDLKYSQVVVWENAVVDFFDNGKIEYVCNKNEDGKEHGKEIYFYRNGQKMYEYNNKNGEVDGKYLVWHENGRKKIEANYKNGILEGYCKEWYENGGMKKQGKFKNGEVDTIRYHEDYSGWGRDGKWLFWYRSGDMYREIHYEEGLVKIFKEWYEFTENQPGGYLKKEVEFFPAAAWDSLQVEGEAGDAFVKEYWENGNKYRELRYRNGKLYQSYLWDEYGSPFI